MQGHKMVLPIEGLTCFRCKRPSYKPKRITAREYTFSDKYPSAIYSEPTLMLNWQIVLCDDCFRDFQLWVGRNPRKKDDIWDLI